MSILEKLRTELLPQVEKPGQYLGNEHGTYHKDWDSAKSRMALIYPDLYELGMSNFGLKILYNIVNQHPDYLCDRAYAPMSDMEQLLRDQDLPLWGWESNRSLNDFDLLGFSLAYELCYINIFTILDLPKIPFYSKDRDHSSPLIFAGGPAVFNPEPMAEFFDFYIIGDGEELITEVQDSMLESKRQFLRAHPELNVNDTSSLKNYPLKAQLSQELREKILFDLAQLQGIYVPRFYKPDVDGIPKPITAVPFPVLKRVTQNLTDFNQPVSGPIPNIKTVQDKQVLEIRRGCDRGCRFCQVGYTYLPVRERSPEDLLRLSEESARKSGYEDFTLLSLSASDYTCLTETAKAINEVHSQNGVSLSMPSQRVDRFNLGLAAEISQTRKSGMTFAPEAGTERMRKIINKGLNQEQIHKTIKGSYETGWSHIKLYFMIGLPFEEDSDLDGILDILSWAINMSKQSRKLNPELHLKPLDITCTISTFIPKTFTAFQWFSQCSVEEFKRKQKYLKDGLRERGLTRAVKLNCTEPELALIESVLSRADRSWSKVLLDLWQSGSRLQSWNEHFDINRWKESAAKFNLDLDHEAMRHREPGSKQPWDVLSIGFTDEFLVREWQAAIDMKETLACTENKCHACGVCFNLDVKNLVSKDLSDHNPFVDEISRDKRQIICASSLNQEDIIKGRDQDINIAIPKVSPEPVGKNTATKQKVRLKITKIGDLRFISHLDFQRLFEHALRRSGLPVVFTNGFNQRIKISWGPALGLFIESFGEYIILELAEVFVNLETLKEILNKELPKQARITEVVDVVETYSSINHVLETNFQAKLISFNKPSCGPSQIFANDSKLIQLSQERIDEFLTQTTIEITKSSKGKASVKNIRDQIIRMKFLEPDLVEMTLNGTQRPDEVLNALMPQKFWQISKTSTVLAAQTH